MLVNLLITIQIGLVFTFLHLNVWKIKLQCWLPQNHAAFSPLSSAQNAQFTALVSFGLKQNVLIS